MNTHVCATILALFLVFPLCVSQDIKFTPLTNPIFDGGVNCTDVYEDSYGQLWFNTYIGVIRYDGMNLTVFQSDPDNSSSINHNITTDMVQVGDDIYVVTWGNGGILNKISLLDHKVTRIKYEEDLNVGHRNIFKLHHGYHLAGGDSCLLYFHPEHIAPVCLPHPYATPLFQEENDEFLIAVRDELITYKIQQGVPFLSHRQKVSARIACAEVVLGKRVFGSSRGLLSLDTSLHIPTRLQNINIGELHLDSYDRLWIGTRSEGLFLWNVVTNEIRHFLASEKPGDLQSNSINCLYEDKHSTLWIGTSLGLTYVNLRSNFISSIPEPPGSSFPDIGYSIFEDKEGILWIGTNTHISLYDRRTQSYRKTPIPIPQSIHVIHIRADRESYLVASNSAGAFLLERNSSTQSLEIVRHFAHIPEQNNGLSSNVLMNIFQDKDGGIWFGTYNNGIDFLHPDGLWQHLPKDQLQGIAVSRILEMNDTTIWISKWDNGLSKCTIRKDGSYAFSHFTPQNSSLNYQAISSLAEDGFQNLWIGTMGGGLYKLEKDADAFIRYSTPEGLTSNNVFSVICDKYNNIWSSTANGLALLEAGSNKFRIFKDTDGLPQNGFLFYSDCLLSDGGVAFGTNSGIALINPDSLNSQPDQFKPIISRIKIYNKPLTPGEDGPIHENPYLVRDLRLDYDQDLLTFEFANNYFINPQRVKYAYFLEGFDRQWVELGNSNVATFTRLPPDKYTLHVKSSIDEGSTYTEMEHPLKITILPPWWRTIWFRILIILSALGIMYYIFHLRTQRLLAIQRIEIEKTLALEAERTRISRDMHDDLGSGLSAIHLMSNYLTENAEEKYPEFSAEIQKIRKSSEDLNQSIREIIWTVNTKDDNLNSLILFIRRHCHELNEKVKTRIHVHAQDPVPEIQLSGIQRKHVFLCVKEALNNALKHGKPSEVNVHITSDSKKQITIQIQDNGVGLNAAELLSMNNGNGLVNMKERMTDIDGTVEILSEGKGTDVRLSFKA